MINTNEAYRLATGQKVEFIKNDEGKELFTEKEKQLWRSNLITIDIQLKLKQKYNDYIHSATEFADRSNFESSGKALIKAKTIQEILELWH